MTRDDRTRLERHQAAMLALVNGDVDRLAGADGYGEHYRRVTARLAADDVDRAATRHARQARRAAHGRPWYTEQDTREGGAAPAVEPA
jgi:hypothetical protein